MAEEPSAMPACHGMRNAPAAEYERWIAGLEEDRRQLRGALRDRDQAIVSLERLLAKVLSDWRGLQTEVSERDERLAEQASQIRSLQGALAQRYAELRQLRAQLTQANTERLQVLKQAERLEAELHAVRNDYQKVKSDLHHLRRARTVRAAVKIGNLMEGVLVIGRDPVAATIRALSRLGAYLPDLKGPIHGAIDRPCQFAHCAGALPVEGWAVSEVAGIREVYVELEGFSKAGRLLSLGKSRPDVLAAAPWIGDANCGYSGTISLADAPPGRHRLCVRVVDAAGNQRQFRRQLVVVKPEHSGEPLSEIRQTGGAGSRVGLSAEIERVSWPAGSLCVEGWALWPGSSPRSTVSVFLDNTYLGETQVNLSRPDVAAEHKSHPSAHRCGFRFLRRIEPDLVCGRTTASLSVKVREASGGSGALLAEATIDLPSSVWNEPAVFVSLDGWVEEFAARFDRHPSILDWHTGAGLADLFPTCAVFSPPTESDELPYVDGSVDLVVANDTDLRRLAEARRVAEHAVAILSTQEEERGLAAVAAEKARRTLVRIEERPAPASVPPQRVSIIIPAHNNSHLTKACLEACLATVPGWCQGEIIVVDDASSDDTSAVLNELASRVSCLRVVRNEARLGFIVSCNRGANHATGDILVFLNNDTLPQPGWLPPLLALFHRYRWAGAAGGKLLYPDGRLQEAGGVVFSDGSAANFGRNDSEPDLPLYNYVREVDYCSGALLATRRTLFNEIGGFDELYCPAYYEDTDYCFKLRARGYRVYYQPESRVIHVEGATSGVSATEGIKCYQSINKAKFAERWQRVLRHQPDPPSGYDLLTWHALAVRACGEV